MKDHGRPRTIRVDNGPEFISKDVDLWAYWNHVTLDFSRPGKPTDNAYIESFNGRFRQECLNEHWFLSLDDAREKVEAWRRDYNQNGLTALLVMRRRRNMRRWMSVAESGKIRPKRLTPMPRKIFF